MFTLYHLLLLTHILGLGLALGGATAKFILLIRCQQDHKRFFIFFQVSKLLTVLIILGMILCTLSGVAWLLTNYPLRPLLIAKIVMVGLIWILGPVIDNVAEPRLRKELPGAGLEPGPGFNPARNRHLLLEIVATLLMYAVTVLGVLI